MFKLPKHKEKNNKNFNDIADINQPYNKNGNNGKEPTNDDIDIYQPFNNTGNNHKEPINDNTGINQPFDENENNDAEPSNHIYRQSINHLTTKDLPKINKL